jgi:hypothetical protein
MQIEKEKLIYSIFSGTFYTIPEKDFNILNQGQIPLVKQPKNSCKKCFGRGHCGRDSVNFTYILCNCIKKSLDLELIKKNIEIVNNKD